MFSIIQTVYKRVAYGTTLNHPIFRANHSEPQPSGWTQGSFLMRSHALMWISPKWSTQISRTLWVESGNNYKWECISMRLKRMELFWTLGNSGTPMKDPFPKRRKNNNATREVLTIQRYWRSTKKWNTQVSWSDGPNDKTIIPLEHWPLQS